MSWYALEKIEEALNQTKDFLTPFDLGLWTRLAVIVLFLGGGLNNVPTGNSPTTDSGTQGVSGADLSIPGTDMTSSMHSGIIPNTDGLMTGAATSDAATLGIIALVGVIALVFVILSSIARFAIFQSVMEKRASIREMFKSNFNRALQLIGLNVLTLIAVLLPTIPYLAGIEVASIVGGVLFFVAVFYWLAILLAMTFVNDFGLPLMVSENINIIDAVKRSLGTVWNQKAQAAIYFLTKIGIGIVIGVIYLVALLTVFLALLIPFGILGFIAYTLSPIAGGVVGVLGLLTLAIVMLYVRVPLEVYRHYFYVLNLEEFEEVELVER